MITSDQALVLLDEAIDFAGGRKAWCKITGISDQYLSDVLCKKTSIGPSIQKILKIKRVVMYEVYE